ncbi:acyl-CoA dehydrogenase family protein [Streptomyces stelliscabiei]|uniref:acyl-CoA dehydrogenase family protein n=1 Tax=Streptomyces stelliscabiei TaxID=146820 RepID=UPI0029BEA3E9|nr:acyl-CoA dehydrogenase family protein [Streptomyces stelliscabiei]MDX2557291.1 acyl-CoA dehydrogenase family protein [Streptomyces stelliscabiei]MDX2616923.1 acyl-CoA dehydrogenase family protein [Streptomyces stelliscabiei]MDX2641287.1 acyl-CoA dehydrogenase family protein [Streptomyces stelliscabiei]MDX2665454.1 acyl-CoA dehydrogenase family protein [Streptomyces stelliscabiei]MDX2715157.1 acyl-CoA dehydrogenase family protein [Streptomyces stelliscabiei]
MLSDPAVQGLHGKAAPAGTAPVTDPATHQARESAVQARIADLENRFGDPQDPANPLGAAGLLAADEAGELPAAGERLLDDVVLNAEFVPTDLGGRLDRLDTLVRVMRQVFRRDVALGLGYGITSFMAAVNVWTAGSEEQRRRTAELLLGGSKVSVAYHELPHGNDFVRNEFRAAPVPGGFRLDGRKEVINNADRADAFALFSRTDDSPGSRSHSVLLVERDQLDRERFAVLPRYTAVGVRGCRLSGLDFTDCPVPDSTLLGARGQGVELALRSFQITRSAVPSMAIGALDTSLRTVVRFALGRQLYRRSVMEIPHASSTLTGAFLDLLICDSMATVGTRAVHLLPDETSVYAAAVKYLVPKMLTDTMYDLSIVLGARFYVREGEFGLFQKHVRDLPVLSLGHAGSAACQATIIPQLSRLARRAWFSGDEAPQSLFRPREGLPGIPFGSLALASGRDSLSASLVAAADGLPSGSPEELAVQALVMRILDQLRQLQEDSLNLSPQDRTALASPASFALADRYAVFLAAASVLGVWRGAQGGDDPFLADPAWVAAALHRLARRLGQRPADLPPGCEGRVHEEVLRRFHERRSYDLYDTPLAG